MDSICSDRIYSDPVTSFRTRASIIALLHIKATRVYGLSFASMEHEDIEIVLRRANADGDVRTSANLSQNVELAGATYEVLCIKAADLSSKQKVTIMDILRDNMRTMYEENGWGWKEVEKRKEVFDKRSRFILLQDSKQEVVAYVIFRFEWDDEDEPEYPVLYCYELQVSQATQKSGAGKVLMQMLMQVAKHYGMRKTSLTVFKNNTAAMGFYKKIGFIVDSNSPSNFGCPDECYEILSDKNF